jgi:hypothetical protein
MISAVEHDQRHRRVASKSLDIDFESELPDSEDRR